VVVEASSEGIVAASAVLYGVPLLGLLCGALLGQIVWGETQSFIGAGIGVVVAIPVVRILANRIPENKRFSARIVRRDNDIERE
jgi:positive regulator of sigma E activity